MKLLISFLRRPLLFLKGKLTERNFFIVSSIIVGLISGLAAMALKYFVHSIENIVNYYSHNYEEFLLFALFPLIGIALTVLFIKYVLTDKIRKGSAEIVFSIIKRSAVIPTREMYAHLVSSGLTVGFGGSVGLESPMVSTGSAIGSNYGRVYKLRYKERTILLGCGAAAGIAAAFNAPIAGVLFAIEVLLTDVSASAFIPLIISAACGALISKMILLEGVILTFSLQQPFNYHNLPFYVLLGILAGIVSLCYARIFEGIEHFYKRIQSRWVKVVTGGIILFILIMLFPPLYGEGYKTIKAIADMNAEVLTQTSLLKSIITNETHLLIFLACLIFLKIVAAAITLGSGGNGGSFGPSLFVGAYLGYVFSTLVNTLKITTIPVSNFTIVAMAGILSGVFYAPLTAIFLIAELTGGYELMIPLMIVSSLSLVVTHFFEPLSMEAKKLSFKLNQSIETRDKLLLSRLDLSTLIETNFSVVSPNQTLANLVKVIASSSRNIFPVVDENQKLIGLVHLDKVRQVIFDHSKYDTITVQQLMTPPAAVVELRENLHQALSKFDATNQWNIPVIDNGIYKGFLSKSTILTRYRHELLESA
ncbi:chloride channel protein [Chryseosolibacter indicus]|uniref:Chloride channel protein n=1 Tax=Chryseosolibacter indicus TaxID=2782351 RepID=A0ABS5VLZ8_9BACT|nr:chloride channel protein [Chryseosolibacter indicus]MBT1702396.1 chloride channel protein [Chryseosolibacter indicus]